MQVTIDSSFGINEFFIVFYVVDFRHKKGENFRSLLNSLILWI